MNIEKEYPYLYETHLHTAQASKCAHNQGYEMARGALAAGYTGIIVTEHNWGGNTCISPDFAWEDWVRHFKEGYESALEYGKEHGLDVFWGYEAGYNGTEFLIYGVSPEFMIAHPELKDADIEEQYRLVHEAGGIVVHAHPFREEWYISEIRLFPEYVDAVEGINATHSNSTSPSHNDPLFNDRAVAYAKEHNLPLTAGSDIHVEKMYGGGMRFKRKLTSIQDFIQAIQNREPYILTDGEHYYSQEGELI